MSRFQHYQQQHQSMNIKNNCTTSSVRTIPLTLIPITNVNTEYAKNTCAYSTLFDKVRFTRTMYNDNGNLIDAWRVALDKYKTNYLNKV